MAQCNLINYGVGAQFGACIQINGGNGNLELINEAGDVLCSIAIPGISGNNIYDIDGVLTGNRVLDGVGNNMTWQDITNLTFADSNGFIWLQHTGGGNVNITSQVDIVIDAQDDVFLTSADTLSLNSTSSDYRFGDGAGGNLPTLDNSTDLVLTVDALTGQIHHRDTSAAPFADIHMANADLTLTGNRLHTGAGFSWDLTGVSSGNITTAGGAFIDLTAPGSAVLNAATTATMSGANARMLTTNAVELNSAVSNYRFGPGTGANIPTNDDSTILVLTVDALTGQIHYRDTTIAPFSDTNMAITDLVLDANRLHNGANFSWQIQSLLSATIVTSTSASLSLTALGQAALSAPGSTASLAGQFTQMVSTGGSVRFDSTVQTYAFNAANLPPFQNDDPILSVRTSDGRIFRRNENNLPNLYTIDGTLAADRVLTGGSNDLTFTGLGAFDVTAVSVDLNTGLGDLTINSGGDVFFSSANSRFNVASLQPFADDAGAGVGGLVVGDLYQTDGAGAAPLNAAGMVMVKQ